MLVICFVCKIYCSPCNRPHFLNIFSLLTLSIPASRLLIAEAEKAAKALELAAPSRTSLFEAIKFIAEAIQSLEGIGSKPRISESSSGAPSELTSSEST